MAASVNTLHTGSKGVHAAVKRPDTGGISRDAIPVRPDTIVKTWYVAGSLWSPARQRAKTVKAR